MRRINHRVALALLLVIGVLAVAGCNKPVVVPDVSKLTLEQARTVLEAKGLKTEVRARLPHDTVPKDGVTAQEPAPGEQVPRGTSVALTISTGPEGSPLPNLVGMGVDEAKLKLQEMGLQFKITKVIDPARPGVVVNVSPPADTMVLPDQLIELTVAEAAPAPIPETSTPAPSGSGASGSSSGGGSSGATPRTSFVVAIDAGHQGRGDSSLEAIGPGSSTRKAKVTGGAVGTVTRQAESELNLKVALKAKRLFEAQGAKVVMVRTTQEVNVSNIERAQIANRANADLFIRIHADSAGSGESGVKTLVPGKNQWSGTTYDPSRRAAAKVQPLLATATGFPDDGIVERNDLTGFNWSKVPTYLVEMGFLSNASEDRALASDAVRERIAQAIVEGSMSYLRSR